MSFSTTQPNAAFWDSLLAPTAGGGYPTHFVNTYRNSSSSPGGVPKAYWCQRISALNKDANQLVAETIDALGPVSQFGTENGKPAVVLWDELRLSTANTIASAANLMLTNYGAPWLYRWGTYLVNGPDVSYSVYYHALDHVMAAGGRIAVELYPYYVGSSNPADASYKNYWQGGSTTAIRDEWMRQFFMGRSVAPNPNPVPASRQVALERLDWLVARKAALWPNSASIIHPIFGVSEQFINGSQPNRFMDRMFYVFQRSPRGALMSTANDLGVGSWTWGESGTTDWDGWFRVMWDYYCVAYSPTKPPRTSAPSAP